MVSERSLEQVLVELGGRIDWPPAVDLSARVGLRLAVPPASRARRRWVPVTVALLLVVAALLLVSPRAREAVADLLGVAGIRIGAVPQVDESLVGELDLGEPVSIEAAGESVDFTLFIPRLLGEPAAVFVTTRPGGEVVTMVWEADEELPAAAGTGIGLLYDQFAPEPGSGGLVKAYGSGTAVQSVTVGGANGFWIEGAAHVIVYEDASGNQVEESARLAGNVLVWEEGGVTHRLETMLDLDVALLVAGSIEQMS